MNQHLGSRGTTWNVDVDGNDLVDALDDCIIIKDTARGGARAHRYHPLWLGHLIVDAPQHGCHFSGNASGNNHYVSLSWAGAKYFRPKSSEIVSAAGRIHHFDCAASQAEGCRPQRRLTRPIDQRIKSRREHFG